MHRSFYFEWAAPAVLLFAATTGLADETSGQKVAYDLAPLTAKLERLIEYEVADKKLPAFSIALVDGGAIVWSKGYGVADPAADSDVGRKADADTIYRVGSVSKLLNAMAVMQLVEQGKVDLDAPIETYLPDFHPHNEFSKPITLRQVLSHRSGLVREPPVGHYFDPTEPGLAATVASLNDTSVVYAPETRTKYSNAAPSVGGLIVERIAGKPYAASVGESLLSPLGMANSSFELGAEQRAKLAEALMWTVDGREFPAPKFSLGTGPAGNLYASVNDLSQLLIALFAGGKASSGKQILKAETLEAMWRPQFVAENENDGFGLGFYISQFDGHRQISHGGAVYGFSTLLAGLPEEKIGVAASASRDVCNSSVGRIGDYALRLMLAARAGKELPDFEAAGPIGAERAKQIAGRFRAKEGGESGVIVEAQARGERLMLSSGDMRVEVKVDSQGLVIDDELSFGARVEFAAPDELSINGKAYFRIADDPPAPAPDRWHGLIGEYGWDHNTLYILEANGKLHALIEWCFNYPLEEIDENTFAFPDRGLYHGEKIHFERDEKGRATAAIAAEVRFERRQVGPDDGATFKIEPLKSIEALRTEAAAATPPEEPGEFLTPDLVEPAHLDPTIKLDIRYATTNNFMGAAFYSEGRAFLQRPAAEALVAAHRDLAKHGYGIVIHDAYRPWSVTKMFYEATPPEMRQFVADPSKGSRHNRGCAVDISLYDLATGKPAPTVAGYDEFSPRSFPDYPGGQSIERWRRELLRQTLEAHRFTVYEFEWWHFDFADWRKYPILNLPFDDLDAASR